MIGRRATGSQARGASARVASRAAAGVLCALVVTTSGRIASAAPPTGAASPPAPFIAEHAVEEGLVPRFDLATLGPPVKRCGWWDNPTPGNVGFTDRDGEWTVALQAAYEAAGDGPDFAPGQTAPRGASHTHGCACMMVRADRETKIVYSIAQARPLPLSTCRGDPALKGKEPTPR